jgi:hypothetical protein
VYIRAPLRRLPRVLHALEATSSKRLSPARRAGAWLRIPALRALGDIAKMLGYPAGWRWRLGHNPPDWRV